MEIWIPTESHSIFWMPQYDDEQDDDGDVDDDQDESDSESE